ncbi:MULTISPECIES: hypothetical protein [unclassified Clostridium]|uniref:hypothetical protein n=1 Tax=unclassified Clostridium TaxID=2614128 RepID=UPI00207AC921|nr:MULTISPECIES: hypothetical protein [unclassified Clostridium]
MDLKELNNIELSELTNNTIILFQDKDLLYKFKMGLESVVGNMNYENVDFTLYDDAKTVNIDVEASSNTIGIYNINHGEQQLILGTEGSLVLLVKDLDDLWFVANDRSDNIECYALSEFEDCDRYKNDNIRLYKAVNQGKFGCIGVNR